MSFDHLRPRDALDPSNTPNKARLWKNRPATSSNPVYRHSPLITGVYKAAEPPLASTHSYSLSLTYSLRFSSHVLQSFPRFSMLRSATPRFVPGI